MEVDIIDSLLFCRDTGPGGRVAGARMVRATEMEIGEFRVGQHWILLDVLGSGLRDHRTAGRLPDRVAQPTTKGMCSTSRKVPCASPVQPLCRFAADTRPRRCGVSSCNRLRESCHSGDG